MAWSPYYVLSMLAGERFEALSWQNNLPSFRASMQRTAAARALPDGFDPLRFSEAAPAQRDAFTLPSSPHPRTRQ